jgi:hypothetical protein
MYDEITLEGEDSKWGIIGVILLGFTIIFLMVFTLMILEIPGMFLS